MAWFLNHYECDRCGCDWQDEWSCMSDDECPDCGARDMTPCKSDDLTTLIEREGPQFVVLCSPETAEDDPAYQELGRFPTEDQAVAFLAAD